MPQIEAQSLTKTYYSADLTVPVLKDISFSIEQGEFVAIMGPSGSGKSTLMNIIGCLDLPTSGKYSIEGNDISRLSADERAALRNKKIGFIFQQFNLLSQLSALDNAALPQLYANSSELIAQEKGRHYLTLLGLADRLDYYPYQLSGGQQQRVAIARALVNEPSLLLADEPTGALDSKTGIMIMETFARLNKEQKLTVILITHDQKLAHTYADRTIHLLDGAIVDPHEPNNSSSNHSSPDTSSSNNSSPDSLDSFSSGDI